MNELHLTLSAEEQRFLADLLTEVLKEKRVEEHRTRTPTYRERILAEEAMLQALLDKLHLPAA